MTQGRPRHPSNFGRDGRNRWGAGTSWEVVAANSREQRLVQDALPGYDVAGELGRGAFGVVYTGHHRQLNRPVAIKQLPRAFAADPAVRERFVAEAQMVASLDHPHIVPVYDFVDREDGMCLIIMERCSGALSDRFGDEGLATDEACAAILACCAALDFAHGRGLLHRDIKPENLLYDADGVVKLGDFGIARALDADVRRTATGMVIGTPAYMSPEQVRGEDLTAASDVYSVGIMAYELLTGGFPFEGANSATGLLAHHLVTEPTPLTISRAELPTAIGEVIDRSLAKSLEERQGSAEELAVELTKACVASFGTGWIRRRRFVLHWPEVIAASEQPQEGGVRTGTIMVRADDSRSQLVRGGGAPAAEDESTTTPTVAPSATPTPTVAPLRAPEPSTVAPPGDLAGQQPPPPQPPPPLPSTPVQGPPASLNPPPGPSPEGEGQGSNRNLVIGAAALAVLLAIVGFAILRSGGNAQDTATDTQPTTPAASDAQPDQQTEPSPETPPADPADNATPTVEPTNPSAFEAGILVDSAWVPSPCPRGPERTACLLGVAADESTGEIIVPYDTVGFVPELDPIDFHVHFYLDTAVDGDERKAGAEVPGGSWKIWDGLSIFTSFGGENGRTGFTVADVEAAGARRMCVLVATPEHFAVPGTGNCALIGLETDIDLLLEEIDRLTGTYIGRCGIGATLIVPDSWRWLDLTVNSPADAARILRPTDIAQAEPLLAELISSGGLLWADGPVDDGFIVNLSLVRIEGNFSPSDSPDTVRELLGQSGITLDGTVSERTLLGRTLVTQVVNGDTSDLTQYIVPDFGYAIVMSFGARDGAKWQETSDAIAATLFGC